MLKTTCEARRRFFASLSPRERWSPSEWAERCRKLAMEESDEPGAYTFDRTPFWRFVCDAVARVGVEEVVCLKGAQIGWSETCRNIFGYWVDLDPGPVLFLLPDQNSADAFKVERIEPLLKNTPAVRQHLTGRAWDETKYRIRFDAMWAFLTWAGSKTGTKSRPIRRLVCEEPDEYPPFSSAGGDPLSKAEKRLTTARAKGRSSILVGGTPTNRRGNIWKRWESCAVRYHYWVPCPQCNGYQTLLWKQVKWPELKEEERAKKADRIKSESLAYYECEHCKTEIRDHQKPRMLQRGVWASEDQVVTPDGRVAGPERQAKRIGFKVSGLYSPWVSFGQLAAEWLESQDDPQALADFINQRLAEPFEEQRAKPTASVILERSKGAPEPMQVPSWARLLLATADTQGTDESTGYFWYVIRAWGYGYRSQLVDFGVCSSKDELRQRCLERQIPMEGKPVAPSMLLVDSGGPRWQEVYQLAQSDMRIRPTKGSAHVRQWMVNERPQKAHGIVLWEIDTEQAKDLLYQLIYKDPDQTKWMPNSGVNDDYAAQMSSEAKVFDPSQGKEVWVEIVKKNNHLWDCEATQCAAAWRLGCGMPEPVEAPKPRENGNSISANEFMNRGRKW